MIAPIRPVGRPPRSRPERSGVRKARRWVARSLLDPAHVPPFGGSIATRGVWPAVGWMLFVAAFYLWHMLRERFEVF
ncbi:MAG: hypothetical protein JNL96_22200 [Planctomycetaceae bacterium]|nr:hypothetical protein [Planctomycetaceae bacterium]